MGTPRNSKNTSSRSFVEVESPAVFSNTLEEYRKCTVRILDCFENAFALTGVGADASTSELSEAKFIDVGCGEGSFTLKYLLPRCSSKCQKLVGVDKSSAMLEHARLRHGHDMIEYLHLDIVCSDVDEFVKQHGHFTRVYSFHLLHWVKDRAQALKNIEKLIAPGGECFIVFEHCIPIFEVFMALAESPRWRKYVEVLLENVPPLAGSTDVRLMRTHLLSIVNETGLTPLTCEVLRSPVVSMPNLKEATDRAVSYNPIYPLLEDEEKEDLVRSTADILAGRAEGIAEGKVSGDRFTYVIHAYKPAQ